MSRFVDEDWSVWRPADEPRPVARNWSTWVRRERLMQASEEVQRERWVLWNRENTPSAELLASLERAGKGEWVTALGHQTRNVDDDNAPARPDPLLLRHAHFDDVSLRWALRDSTATSSGALTLLVAGAKAWRLEAVQPHAVLEWMTDNWTRLTVEDQLPISGAERLIHDRANQAPPADLEGLRQMLFRKHRDLQQVAPGQDDNPLVVWREGLVAQLRTATNVFSTPWAKLEAQLVTVCQTIIEGPNPLPLDVVERWRTRNVIDATLALDAAGVAGENFPDAVAVLDIELNQERVSIEENELLAAARLSSRLETREVAEVLDALLDVDKGDLDQLEAVASGLYPDDLDLAGMEPWDQGHAAALLVRQALGLSAEDPFDPEQWLEAAGVEIRDQEFKSSRVDAVSCWGATRGPAVVVNKRGLHAKSVGGRRVTLAHEIAHLILDRHAALPAAEVLSGQINNSVEKRAGSFAAEILLPRQQAAHAFKDVHTLDEARDAVDALIHQFGVSGEVVAWQARNSGSTFSPSALGYLRSRVRDRKAFDRPLQDVGRA